jgi:azurin
VTFDAPPRGTYDFVCTFPGHATLMRGKFIVR